MKLGHILAAASWVSTFVLIWLMIAEAVEPHPATAFLVFFLCLAVVVSAILASDKDGKKEKGSNNKGEALEWGTLLDRSLDDSVTTAHYADGAVTNGHSD